MKQNFIKKIARGCQTAIAAAALVLLLVASWSFTMRVISSDFVKEIVMNKTETEQKNALIIFSGYLEQYGLHNAKSIAQGNRVAVVKDQMAFTKNYTGTPVIVKQYSNLRKTKKSGYPTRPETPEDLQESLFGHIKKAVTECEVNLKKALPSIKIFVGDGESVVVSRES